MAGFFFGTFFIAAGLLNAFAPQLQNWAYVGAFAISLVSSATVVLPAPGTLAVMVMAQQPELNVLLLGLVSGIGTGLGGGTAYLVGFASSSAVGENRLTRLAQRLFTGRRGPILLFVTNFLPFLPGDAISAIAGTTRYPIGRYLLYVTTASILKMIVLAFLGAYAGATLTDWLKGLETLVPWPGATPLE
ncbi:MAG: VTT domain-containing protein [Chloroflexi bacterium]|nr:VTT domain-containing protein [Chloroflexota bacterium]